MQAVMQNKVTTNSTVSTFTRVLNVALWILQALLAALFFWHGRFMAFPPANMVAMINTNIGEGPRVCIGVAEMLAAAGLLLPGLTRILPFLTTLAAAGLMIVMSSATVFHLLRGETASAISTMEDVLAVHDNVPPGVAPSDNETGWRMSLGKLARLVEAAQKPGEPYDTS